MSLPKFLLLLFFNCCLFFLKDMIDMLSRAMVVRLLHLVQLVKDIPPSEKGQLEGLPT